MQITKGSRWSFETSKHLDTDNDSEKTMPAKAHKKIQYPKPDGILTFDILTNVAKSNTFHEENQPCHLQVKDQTAPLKSLQAFEGIE